MLRAITVVSWSGSLEYKKIKFQNYSAGDSWHSCILIGESSFIFADEMNHFRYYFTSLAPCLKGFVNTKL